MPKLFSKKTLFFLPAIIFLIAAGILFSTQKAEAAEYYMAPNGNDAADCTNINTPCKTLFHFSDPDNNPSYVLKAGDTLYVRGGTYTPTGDYFKAVNSGTQANPITIKAYPGEIPIFQSTGCPWVGASNYGMVFALGKDWYVIDGLQFYPTSGTYGAILFYLQGDHNLITNITAVSREFLNVPDIAEKGGSATWYSFSYMVKIDALTGVYSADYNEISYCNFWGTGYHPLYPGTNAGYNIGLIGNYNKVHHCTLQKGGHEVVSVGGDYNEIYNNNFGPQMGGVYGVAGGKNHTLVQDNIFSDTDRYYMGCSIYFVKWPRHTIARRNVIYKNNYASFEQQGGQYSRVYNNVFWGADRSGLWLADGEETALYHKFLNNVIAKNVQWGEWTDVKYAGGSPSQEVSDRGNDFFNDSRDNQVKNNWIVTYLVPFIGGNDSNKWNPTGVWQNGYRGVSSNGVMRSVSEMEASHTTWSNNISTYSDPKFVSPDTGNFTTQSGSSLIDKGRQLTQATNSGSNSTSLIVDDPYFFWASVSNKDTIKIGGSVVATVNAVNYSTKTLTLSSPASWSSGASVSLDYSGTAPDIGVYESLYSAPPPPDTTPPAAPSGVAIL